MSRRMLGLVALAVACGGGDSSPAADARAVDVACDPAAQDCPTGQKCNPTGPPPPDVWSGTACVDDNADTGSAAGTPCFTGPDGADTCDQASLCLQLGTGEGFCTPYCSTTGPDTCDASERCVRFDDALGLDLCAPRCDLAAADCAGFYECVDTRAGPACVPYVLKDRIP